MKFPTVCLLAVPLALLAGLGLLAGSTVRAEEPAVVLEDPEDPVVLIKTSMGDIKLELFAKEAPKTVANFLGLAEGTKEWTDPKTGATVTRPFYDGLVFHRVIDGFMIQGGCPVGNGTGGPGYEFEDEINAEALGLGEIKAFPGGQPHRWMGFQGQEDFQIKFLQTLFAKMGITSQADLDRRRAEVEERMTAMTLKEAYEVMGYSYVTDRSSHPPKEGVIAMANTGPDSNGSQFFIDLKDTPHLTGRHTVFGRVVAGMDVVKAIGKVETDGQARPKEPVRILSIRRVES